MTAKKSYSRYFIILQEEEKGYSLASDKLPSGYAKVEIKNDKCKISYYVQNLKKELEPYHMILICSKKDVKKIIKLGNLNIDDNGRTEINMEFDSEDIDGSKIGIEKVVGASIVKFQENNLIPVMQGFTTTENLDEWKKYEIYTRQEAVEDLAPVIKEEEQVEQVMINESIREPEVEVKEKVQSEPEVEVKEEVQSEPEVLEIETRENEQEDAPAPETRQADNIDFEKYEKEIETVKLYEEEKEFPSGAAGEYFKNLAEGLEEIQKLSPEIKRCRWYKVPIKHGDDFSKVKDFNRYSVIYYPMEIYSRYIEKYRHFAVGYKYDKNGRMKYIVFAIPGKKYGYEQPFDGKSGFVTWVPSEHSEHKEGTFGYWLMFYDFRNRTIAIPIK